jgi:uncharacterized YccA/Bax inhibitor family protein
VKTSNPVLTRLGQAAERERAAGYAPVGQYGQQPGYSTPYPTTDFPAAPPTVRPMTVDDVVVKTVALLGILGASATAAWALVPDSLLVITLVGSVLIGFVLAMIISFARMGLPQRYSWVAAFGILVSLIWLYLEMLRLISYFQGDD